MEGWKDRPPVDYAAQRRETLELLRKRWDQGTKRLGLRMDELSPDTLLAEASDAFRVGDVEAQAKALERIRLSIGWHLFQKAVEANNPSLQSNNAYPDGGMGIDAGDIQYGKAKLNYFSGTSGERILVSRDGMRLPWVHDEKHHTHTNNLLLRDALKALFPSAQGEDGHELLVPFAI